MPRVMAAAMSAAESSVGGPRVSASTSPSGANAATQIWSELTIPNARCTRPTSV